MLVGASMHKHNKKRNVGLMNEFLSKHIASCIINKKDVDVDVAQNLWLKHVGNSKSELSKEHALFNALYKTNVKNREVAAGLLESVKNHCKKLNSSKLDKEKTELIHEIKASIKDSEFFNREVSDYRTCATIQILMNSWRENDPNKLAETTFLEDQILEHLIKENKFAPMDPNVLSMQDKDIDGLVVSIMTEKFNKKYDNVLTDAQKNLVNLYVFSADPNNRKKLVEALKEVRITTLSYIDYETRTSTNKRVVDKLKKVKSLLEGKYKEVDHTQITDDMVTFYMTASKLREELTSNETA